MPSEHYLKDAIQRLKTYKDITEKAVVQVNDKDFFAALDNESNSIAIIMKHVAGNLRSRWVDFLTTDGEKSDRHRDSEFVSETEDTRASIMQSWQTSWRSAFEALDQLEVNDLDKTVFIRSEPHSVIEAVNRQLMHNAYHIGQIIFLTKHFAGDKWQSLSIPRGESEKYTAIMRRKYNQ